MKRRHSLQKKWTKPRLIILIKGKPEESVLEHCKYITRGSPGSAPVIHYNMCEANRHSCAGYCDVQLLS